MEKIDAELYNSAAVLKYILPEDLHDRAIDDQSISIEEDKYIADKLTKLIKEIDFKYTYTIIKQKEELFFIASDISADPESTRGTFYFHPYENADASFITAFDKKEPSYQTVSDKWGIVRTVMVPEESPGGIRYLACVDYDISYINGVLRKNLQRSITTVFFFLFLSVPLIIIYTKLHSEYLASLRESEEKYRQIYENIIDVYCEASLDGTILEISPSIEKYSHYKREEFIGKSIYDIYSNPVDRKNFIETILKKGSLIDYEINFTDKDGTQYICSLNIELIKDTKGTPIKIVGIFRDISDRKRNEAEKIQAHKNAAEHKKLAFVGQIAGKMAHDFNNVLGIIMGNTELSLLDCKDADTKKTLELIYNQTIRGKNLTKNLVAFAKDQEPKQKNFLLNEKMELVLTLLKKDLEGINLIREYSHGMSEILADPGMIEHAVVNLIQNSIHATSLAERPKIIIRTYQKDEWIFMEIEDNGCGIPQEFLGEIFEPSFSLKGDKDTIGMYKPQIKGTGYGMSNVKKYIDQHKGDISIRSEFQKNTKVTVKLPIIKKKLTYEEITQVKKQTISAEKHILLVEDEQAISNVQYRTLTNEPYNHKVDIAGSSEVALDLLNRNKYDLISLDYALPGKFNGMDVYHHIREKNKIIPVLFISGNIEFLESIKDLNRKDPYIDHLSKPCKNIDYATCVNKLLERVKI